MPPKLRIGRKQNKSQSDARTQHAPSSTLDKPNVNSTIRNSIEVQREPSLDSHVISSPTDVLTITDNDRHFVRVSKQILQYELKRKRINVEPMMKRAFQEGDEITLLTSTPSDWRLVLQDSITTDDLRQGCISLFDQVKSGMEFSPNELFHAVHYLEYATIHIEHGENGCSTFVDIISTEEKNCRTKLPSALLKLVCHPSNRLRAVALAFFDVGQLNLTMTATGLVPQLFERLKPHEIPLNRTTFEFHRHITSIMDNFFVRPPQSFDLRNLTSNLVDPIFQPFCTYVRRLIAPPVSPTDCPSGISLLSKMEVYDENIKFFQHGWYHQDLGPVFSELRENMKDELASLLDIDTTRETLHQLLFGKGRRTNELNWTETFASILVGLSEGRHLSDVGLQAFLLFMSNRPYGVKAVPQPDGTFSLKVDGEVKATLELPTSFINALVPTRPHYAAAILRHFHWFFSMVDPTALLMNLKCGWFAKLFNAVTPSKLPFTNEFLPLHTQLVRVMKDYLDKIRNHAKSKQHDPIRSEQNEICLSFHQKTRDYIVHLSLHPFALITKCNSNPILDFFTDFFGSDFENSMTKPFREELRKDMDETALSSSSPPFILTSELVCRLTDDEIMNVADRIVALIESDSPISDDTILRICAFHTNQLKSVYLPELFRKAGRSTEQYFHALNSLISVTLDHRNLLPVNFLLTSRPPTLPPTFDEWDDVDLSTVGVVMPTNHENRLSFEPPSSQHLDFVAEILPRISHCTSRLTLTQLDQLLTPSIDVVSKVYLLKPSTKSTLRNSREDIFLKISRLCEQHVIAQCLSRIGFFSRIVGGLLDDRTFNASKCFINIFLRQTRSSGDERAEKKMLRRRASHFIDEGCQDIVEFIFVTKTNQDRFNSQVSRIMEMLNYGLNPERDSFPQLGQIVEMMGFCGANLNRRMY
ncbi:hypothetical protein BLNAU_3085 [Blattamonas nauphoetae]|uniref:Uncharacterized protein n=1 Tax=Blattamonas nauphoetae TaxID=2049346 RepID=A0ABQ9YEK8_9EUKA|nr:hypothetical protein BLNAU_3085 [Blattamonas nauphoetae]